MTQSQEFTRIVQTLLLPLGPDDERPKLTTQMIEEAEGRVGHRLPDSYLALLGVRNGGYLEKRRHARINGEVNSIMGVGDDPCECLGWYSWDEVLEYMSQEGIREPSGLRQMVPFVKAGNYLVCFDHRVPPGVEPRISFVDVELFEPSVLVAESFEEFVLGLTE